jgi:hypothetical protein
MDFETSATFHTYEYQGALLHIDQRIAEAEQIQIRVNPYLRQGKQTYRALQLGLKETQWPQGPE